MDSNALLRGLFGGVVEGKAKSVVATGGVESNFLFPGRATATTKSAMGLDCAAEDCSGTWSDTHADVNAGMDLWIPLRRSLVTSTMLSSTTTSVCRRTSIPIRILL
jgi:hypothetical protein